MDIKWKNKITSFAPIGELTIEQVGQVINCLMDKFQTEYENSRYEKSLVEYKEYPVAIFQLKKIKEIDDLWASNLKYNIEDGIVTTNIEFEVIFPDSFDLGDAKEWCREMNYLYQVYLFVFAEHLSEEGYRDPVHALKKQLCENLSKNQIREIYHA